MAGSPDSLTAAPFRAIGALLAGHRQRAAEQAALVDVERDLSISFAELASTVDGIAHQLLQRGVSRGTRVLLTGGNGIDKLLLWLGIWRVGAIVCPLDLSFIKPAIAQAVVGILKPAVILVAAGADRLPFDHDGATVVRHGAWPASAPAEDVLQLAAAPGAPLLPEGLDPGIDDLACICCTSGTTGVPKLLVYDHACYWYNGIDSIDVLELAAHDRLLEYRSFDWYSAQILSLMPLLQAGLTLCVARRFSRTRLAGWIRRHRISVCAGVPAVLNILLAAPLAGGRRAFEGVRAVTCSSAPLSRLQWERFEQRYGVEVANLYGSSEAGWMCANRPDRRQVGSVGYPARHIDFAILDDTGAPCPPGRAGQVVVAGAKLALGLLGAAGTLTPIRGTPFATRDSAVWDGAFVRVLGRMDDLVIRGGVNIAPQEIEDVLLAHPLVAEAVALGVPDPIYGQEPACFVVPHAGTTPDPAMLQAHCREHLPRQKLPKYMYVVAALPRNARGKVLRDALRREWWTANNP
jgi:acyl-coenzyme A synthetase/AMP-(fatty) acid ligase